MLSLSLYAQPQGSKTQELVIVTGKPLSASDSLKVKDIYFEGLKQKISQNTKEAIKSFNSVVQIDPQNHEAYYELAQIYFANKDLLLAKENIEKAVAVNSANEWYWILSASIYEDIKDYKLLNYALDELISISPDRTEYILEKANTLNLLGRSQDALKVYNDLEAKEGVSTETIEGKQRIYRSLGDFKTAEAELKKLIQKEPGNYRYYIYLGDLYFNKKEKEKALEAYKKVKELEPGNGYVNLALSDIYNADKKTEEAFLELTQAFRSPDINLDQKIKIVISYFALFPDLKAVRYAETLAYILTEEYPDDAKAFAIYGDVVFQKGEYEKAKDAYEKSVALNKNIYAVWDQLIRIKLNLNDLEGVIKTGEEALIYFPNSGTLYVFTAIALNQSKQSEKAVKYLNNALNYDLDKVLKIQVYSSLGDAYENLKKYKESANAYEKALELDANNVYALNNYAYYLSLRNENLDKAEKMSLKSNQLSPNNASFLDTYAWVLFKHKKYSEAKEWIEKALKVSDRNNAVLLEHYGDILYHLNDKEQALENWKKAKELGEDSTILNRKINERKYSE
ncbi:tetratricopeptide repeat protein [Pseudopedobacter beijingensis]|uniref:Tetratricopeptide repeat protein n=1 Tax=Pseudopedobacter beijingensis TaxID=1207056 RepID=A0ABW4I9K5_9SPHI